MANAIEHYERHIDLLKRGLITHEEYKEQIEWLKDVRPAIHAVLYKTEHSPYACSNCHRIMKVNLPISDLNFCFHCGARFDGIDEF